MYLHRVGRTGRIGKKGTAHQPHLRPRAGHAHRAGEEVRHQVREAADARAGRGDARCGPSATCARSGGAPRRSIYEGFLPLAGQLKAPPGRRRPDRVPAQVLLQPPAHGEGPGRREPRGPCRRSAKPERRPRGPRAASGSGREGREERGERAERAERRERRAREARPPRAEHARATSPAATRRDERRRGAAASPRWRPARAR